MFAPKVAKPQTKAAESPTGEPAPQRSVRGGHRFGQDPVERALLLQSTIGNQAPLPLLAQQTSSLTENRPDRDHEQEADPANATARGATPAVSWDFSKIPIFPPERLNERQAAPPQISRTRAGCEEKWKRLQEQAGSPKVTLAEAPAIVHG
jgi:hypothetical protein